MTKYLNASFLFKKELALWYSFMKKSTNTNLLVFIKFDDIKIVNFDRMKEWFKSQNYEKDNLKKSCQRLKISWRELNRIVYRIDEMTINIQFRYWQSIVVNWMLKMRNKALIENYILENYINIEKIIEILKYLVMMSDFHAQRFISFSYSIENVSSISIISRVCESFSLSHFHWKDWKTITDTFSSLVNTNWKTFTNFLLFLWLKMLINFSVYTRARTKVVTSSRFCEIHTWNNFIALKASVNQRHC